MNALPVRARKLIEIAVENCWTVTIVPRLYDVSIRFARDRDIVAVWQNDGTGLRLASCDLLGKPMPNGYRGRAASLLLRDLPSLFREGT